MISFAKIASCAIFYMNQIDIGHFYAIRLVQLLLLLLLKQNLNFHEEHNRRGSCKKPKSNCNMIEKCVIDIVAECKKSKLVVIAKQASQIVAVSQRNNCHLFNIVLTLSNRYNLI
jgi:hypothetical protein